MTPVLVDEDTNQGGGRFDKFQKFVKSVRVPQFGLVRTPTGGGRNVKVIRYKVWGTAITWLLGSKPETKKRKTENEYLTGTIPSSIYLST